MEELQERVENRAFKERERTTQTEPNLTWNQGAQEQHRMKLKESR
jgi:hypothetical protein